MCEIKAVKVHVKVRTLRQVNGQVHKNYTLILSEKQN